MTSSSPYILGLHNAEDAGVCLLKGDTILTAVNEERFNQIKLYKGCPEKSLNYVLETYDLTLDDIDWFVYGWHGRQNDYLDYAERLSGRIIDALKDNPDCGDIIKERLAIEISRDKEVRVQFEDWMQELGVSSDKIAFVDHHQSHTWGAFACSPFEEALVFAFDGRGDMKSTSVCKASVEDGILELDYQLSFDSLGFLYGQITTYLGYKAHRHEGKVLGLAAYGDPEKTIDLFRSLIEWREDRFVARLGPYKPFYTNLDAELTKQLDKYTREDIAAGLQAHCTDIILKYVEHWQNKVGAPYANNICLSGGVAANVQINQSISDLPGVENVYVFPHMGDGGLSMGSALQFRHRLQNNGSCKIAMPTAYLGTAYEREVILAVLDNYKNRVSISEMGNKVEVAVDDLRSNLVVGFFNGRMEFGPRALGARSILCHARDASTNDWLNDRLGRSEFMPFAPVTPEEYADECYVNWRPDQVCSRFMTRTYNCTQVFQERHPAVVHVDGTARPQIVRKDLNGDYYKIVKAYCDITGERALINTSFNHHERPIVCSPEDAVQSLLHGNVDVLLIEDFRVEVAK